MHKRHNVFCDHRVTASVSACYARPTPDLSIPPAGLPHLEQT